jgi:hypothetical protein
MSVCLSICSLLFSKGVLWVQALYRFNQPSITSCLTPRNSTQYLTHFASSSSFSISSFTFLQLERRVKDMKKEKRRRRRGEIEFNILPTLKNWLVDRYDSKIPPRPREYSHCSPQLLVVISCISCVWKKEREKERRVKSSYSSSSCSTPLP